MICFGCNRYGWWDWTAIPEDALSPTETGYSLLLADSPKKFRSKKQAKAHWRNYAKKKKFTNWYYVGERPSYDNYEF